MASRVLRNCMLMSSCRSKSGILAAPSVFSCLPSQRRYYYEGKFLSESEKKILKVINECNEIGDLLQFSISKRSGLKLLSYRDEVGEYRTLNDPLPILTKQVLTKFYNSVVEPVRNDKGFRGSPVSPPLSAEVLSNVNKVVGICCGANRIMWSSISRKDTHVELDGLAGRELELKPRHHFLRVLQAVREIAEGIPKADVYVLEESVVRVPTSSQFFFTLQRTQLVSFLAGLLAARSSDSHIVAVKTIAVSRLFKLLVGNERVSGQLIVEEIMSHHRHLRVKQEIRYNYRNIGQEEREYLSNPFLLNLAFWQYSSLIPQSSKETNELDLRN